MKYGLLVVLYQITIQICTEFRGRASLVKKFSTFLGENNND